MSGHAKLSPSSASRWMACTKSPDLESNFPNTTSSFAEEGTLAHSICEDMLRLDHNQITEKEFEKKMKIHKKDKYYNEEMLEHCQNYVDFVNLSAFEPGSHIFIEQRLDMTNYIPEGFGTGDCLVIRDRVLKFFDLKFGKGVKVSAVENTQLKIYALGAYNDYGHIFEIDEIELNIFQPRLDGASTWKITVVDLLTWAENELKPKADEAWAVLKGDKTKGSFGPGDACKFCRAKAQCRALADYNMELAAMAFLEPDLLDMDEIAEVLSKKDLFVNWIGSVENFAFAKALEGEKIPGYKLVHGISTRVYSDPAVIEATLKENGFTDIYVKPTLVGITELNKRLGKQHFVQIVEPLLIKPDGKPTLVSVDDKRPEMLTEHAAANAFDDGFENDDVSDLV